MHEDMTTIGRGLFKIDLFALKNDIATARVTNTSFEKKFIKH